MNFVILQKAAWISVALVLGGCAGGSLPVQSKAQTVEEVVTRRAQDRWDALRAGQYEKAYALITPGTRQTLTIDVFRGRIAGATWLDAKVTKVVCEVEVCDVSVKLDYYALPNLKDSQTVSEKWILDGGNWWFVYRG